MTHVGILYPGTGPGGRGTGAADDYDLLARRTGARASVALVPVGEDAHRVGALRELNEPDRLLTAARELLPVEAVLWACTSASFVLGLAAVRRQARELSGALGLPASNTSLAFLAALGHLGVGTVGVAATYPHHVTAHLVRLLTDAGVTVATHTSAGIPTAEEASRLGSAPVMELARRGQHPAAEAVLVPDTALATAELLDELDAVVDVPVLTANQVTLWHALRLARPAAGTALPGLGARSRR